MMWRSLAKIKENTQRFSLPASPALGSEGSCGQSRLSQGGGGVTPWTSHQFIDGSHRENHHVSTESHRSVFAGYGMRFKHVSDVVCAPKVVRYNFGNPFFRAPSRTCCAVPKGCTYSHCHQLMGQESWNKARKRNANLLEVNSSVAKRRHAKD